MRASSKVVDFTGVKDGGKVNKARIPAGDYLAKIVSVEDAKAKDDTFQYFFVIQITKRPSSKLPYYCKLQDNQLWKLRNLLIAAGKTVPKSRQKVDVNGIVGRTIGVTVDDTEYDGKDQSEITGVFPAAELADTGGITADDSDSENDDEGDEDDEPLEDLDEVSDEAEEDEEIEAEPEPELDRSALKAAIKKLNPDFVAKKSQTDQDLADMLAELQKPKPKAKAKKKAAEVTDDELEELDIDAL